MISDFIAVTWPTETKTNILVVIPEWSKDKQPPIEAPEICLSDKDPKKISAEKFFGRKIRRPYRRRRRQLFLEATFQRRR